MKFCGSLTEGNIVKILSHFFELPSWSAHFDHISENDNDPSRSDSKRWNGPRKRGVIILRTGWLQVVQVVKSWSSGPVHLDALTHYVQFRSARWILILILSPRTEGYFFYQARNIIVLCLRNPSKFRMSKNHDFEMGGESVKMNFEVSGCSLSFFYCLVPVEGCIICGLGENWFEMIDCDIF